MTTDLPTRAPLSTATCVPGCVTICYRAGHADAVARQHHRQRRAALHAGVDVREPGRDQLGADQLHRGSSDHDGAHRLPCRPVRPHKAVCQCYCRLHRRLDPVRYGTIIRPDRGFPGPSGHVRRLPRAAVTSRDVRHLSARAARFGDVRVDDGCDGRADLRSYPGRLAHRELQLALGLLHQHPIRHARRGWFADLPEGDVAQQVGQARLDWVRRVEPCHRRIPNHA